MVGGAAGACACAVAGDWVVRVGDGVVAAGLDEKMLLHSGMGDDAQPITSVAVPKPSASMDDWR